MNRKDYYQIKFGAHIFKVSLVEQEVIDDIVALAGLSKDEEKELNNGNGDISDFNKDKDKLHWGCYCAPNDIYLLKELKGTSHETTTLLHELIEAWDSLYDLNLEHQIIYIMSELFTELILRNKKIFVEIINEQG